MTTDHRQRLLQNPGVFAPTLLGALDRHSRAIWCWELDGFRFYAARDSRLPPLDDERVRAFDFFYVRAHPTWTRERAYEALEGHSSQAKDGFIFAALGSGSSADSVNPIDSLAQRLATLEGEYANVLGLLSTLQAAAPSTPTIPKTSAKLKR